MSLNTVIPNPPDQSFSNPPDPIDPIDATVLIDSEHIGPHPSSSTSSVLNASSTSVPKKSFSRNQKKIAFTSMPMLNNLISTNIKESNTGLFTDITNVYHPSINYDPVIQQNHDRAAKKLAASSYQIHPSIQKELYNSIENYRDHTQSGKQTKIAIHFNSNESDKNLATDQIVERLYKTPKGIINKNQTPDDSLYTTDNLIIANHRENNDISFSFNRFITNLEKINIFQYLTLTPYSNFVLKTHEQKYPHLYVIRLQANSIEFDDAETSFYEQLTEKDEVLWREKDEDPKTTGEVYSSAQYMVFFAEKVAPRRDTSYPKSMKIDILNKAKYCNFCRSTNHTRAKCTMAPKCYHCGTTTHLPKFCKATQQR